jgi:3'(2'), 5'-bisphosphate nucleotidase
VRARDASDVVMLCSHTLKDEHAIALQEKYGFTRRQPMDSSVKFCIIAEGGADIYARHGATMEWDIAAGHAVLSAAGGSVTTLEGAPFRYGKVSDGFKNGWFVARGG